MRSKKFRLVVLSLIAASCLLLMSACAPAVSIPAGDYTGTYKCEFEKSVTTTSSLFGTTTRVYNYWGVTADFYVDDDGYIWDLVVTTPEADEASNGEAYYGTLSSTAWDAAKFTAQFSGVWTVADLMAVSVTVNSAGFPEETDCIQSERDVTIIAGSESVCGLVFLAMQSAIEAAE